METKKNPDGTVDRYLDVFTKMPPKGTYPVEDLEMMRAYYTEDDTEVRDKWLFSFPSNNPFDVFNTFVEFLDGGFHPPAWVLSFLKKGLREFLDYNGKTKLDHIFKTKSPGKGKRDPSETWINVKRDFWLYHSMEILKLLFGIKFQDAACMVYAREIELLKHDKKNAPWDYVPSTAAINNGFYKWKKTQKEIDSQNEHFLKLTTELKREYLSKFPVESWPKKKNSLEIISSLKKYLPAKK